MKSGNVDFGYFYYYSEIKDITHASYPKIWKMIDMAKFGDTFIPIIPIIDA